MAGFKGLWDLKQGFDSGKSHYTAWRKRPSPTTSSVVWFDMSMAPGNPSPQYYAATPLTATVLARSTDGGLNHGPNVSPDQKYLRQFLLTCQVGMAGQMPLQFMIADYLMFYSFIDTGTNDVQTMVNTNVLTRYTDGAGVQMIPVTVAPCGGTSPTFVVSYTNSSGVSGRTSQTCTLSNICTYNGGVYASTTGVAATTGLYIGLQDGDSGVRSIESVQFTSGTDVGLMAIVLVKPLTYGVMIDRTAPTEILTLEHTANLPRIYDDAYINFFTQTNGTIGGQSFFGEITTVWN